MRVAPALRSELGAANLQATDPASLASRLEQELPPRLDQADAQTDPCLERALNVAKTASDFATNVDQIELRIARIAGWLGPAAHGLLTLLGLTT